jgi:hypothetical protein
LPDKEVLRELLEGAMTAVAKAAALAMSYLITARFAGTRFSGKVARTVKVEAPHAQSNGCESIVLRAHGDTAHESITCGFVDLGSRACDLRSYATLKTLHEQRQQTAFDLDRREYDTFLAELKILLDGEDFVIGTVGPEQQQAKVVAAPVDTRRGNGGIMVAIGVVAAMVAVAATLAFALK